jgi:F-type H+-transporting ATPase subunit b
VTAASGPGHPFDGGLRKAERVRREAVEVLERYQQQLADARTEAAHIRDEASADAAAIRCGRDCRGA